MKTSICATCGCSLIRLGISNKQALRVEYQSVWYSFCCQGCLTLFEQAADKYINETANIEVCPTCLAEKPTTSMLQVVLNDQSLHFCHCPYCLDTFNKDPQYYIERLEGKTNFKGLFADDKTACCH